LKNRGKLFGKIRNSYLAAPVTLPHLLPRMQLDPLISMTILDFRTQFEADELFRWEFQIDAVGNQDILAVENSVLWHTSGKGDEDIGVHFFERRVAKKNEPQDMVSLRRFETLLPKTPITYDGFILKIHWCIRVRVFLKSGKELAEEIPFRLTSPPKLEKASRPQLRVVSA